MRLGRVRVNKLAVVVVVVCEMYACAIEYDSIWILGPVWTGLRERDTERTREQEKPSVEGTGLSVVIFCVW